MQRTLKDSAKDRLNKLAKVSSSQTNNAKSTERQFFNARIPKSLIRKVKVYCAEHEITIQDFFTELLEEKFQKNANKHF